MAEVETHVKHRLDEGDVRYVNHVMTEDAGADAVDSAQVGRETLRVRVLPVAQRWDREGGLNEY